jgi:hypothetical protein
MGLHHSFHVTAPPSHDEPLLIPFALTLKGISHTAESNGALVFHAAQGPVFAYDRMTVCDAHGTVLHSQMKYADGRVVLEVLEQGEYPLVVS